MILFVCAKLAREREREREFSDEDINFAMTLLNSLVNVIQDRVNNCVIGQDMIYIQVEVDLITIVFAELTDSISTRSTSQ